MCKIWKQSKHVNGVKNSVLPAPSRKALLAECKMKNQKLTLMKRHFWSRGSTLTTLNFRAFHFGPFCSPTENITLFFCQRKSRVIMHSKIFFCAFNLHVLYIWTLSFATFLKLAIRDFFFFNRL